MDGMRHLLLPKQLLVVGQDFLVASMSQYCNLRQLTNLSERYSWPSAPPELIVSINPHERCDADFLQAVFGSAAIVVHLHNQLQYLEGQQRSNAMRSLSFASCIIVPSNFLSSAVQKLFPQIPVHVVPNGVPQRLFYPASEEECVEFRAEHRLPRKKLLVGFIGALTDAKGLQVVRSICSKMSAREFTLLLQYPAWSVSRGIGDLYGRIATDLKARNPSDILLWPDISPRTAPRPVRYLDVLISPSLSEVQPLTVLEALMSGVPTIATKATPFYDELVDSGVKYVWCRTIPLPARFKEGSLERSKLTLTDEEAGTIADDIIGVLGDHQQIGPRDHETMPLKIKELGFTEDAMCSSFSKIYDQAVLSFGQGTRELRPAPT